MNLTIDKKHIMSLKKRKNFKKKFFVISSVSLFCLLLPIPAYAYESDTGFWDVGGKISDMICEWLLDLSQTLFNGYFSFVSASTSTSYISGKFSMLFGSETVYSLVETVHGVAVIPLAESILALFMLVQLVKISQRIDATATLPAVKDIVFLAISYVIFHWLIINSLDIVAAIFDEFNKIVTSFQQGGANPIQNQALDWSDINLSDVTVGNCIVLVLAALVSYGTGFIAYIVSLLVVMARVIQLYVMAAFAPIPLSLLGFDETRQSGINFIKNFCAACLAGAIIMFIFIAYPTILASTVTQVGSNDLLNMLKGGTNITPIFSLSTWIVVSILLILGLIKSGAWAKEILGS
ncbi:VirB6/TrbL-like conjugal transfer protein, CD1112 family [Enterococcus sp. AN402]|uniref:VirB6/TrbL-like conjugal transfer protein, CD1112 family n=1 Tax=Enterococcus sp. AN402 TaxID=3151386 RepID=UPI00345A2207